MIEVSNVSRLFGEFRAVDDISFSIKTGEIVGLLGPNGAGKTTTMRMIAGFLDSSSGFVKIDGIDVKENPVKTKSKIGYMPESAPMYSDMIVADYLEYIANVEGQDPTEKLPHLVEICGLKEVMHKNIGELSRGNKQRVGLAHALMNDPEILILDEPTSGLDPNQVSEVRELIKKIGETRTVIISTHILSEVEMLCNRVIIISGGKKVADSSTEELRTHYGNTSEVIVLTGGTEDIVKSKFASIQGSAGVKVSAVDGKIQSAITVEGNAEIRPEVAKVCVDAGIPLYEMQLKKNSLEDVFKILTEAK
ncbi:MAG: ATP-binding cassette domain-containing protein [Treponema sp.]|uniref:ABC transporter ATP-binding protein n=1 Tax=Treponema sp. TaxID=166 RepID=UPI001D44D7F0|nr:ATP-binding cassette domain-containing protein [Treponema sp.]MBS7241417.1 ATP-binding cassette domain-containing protein [Treponema sp.]